MFAMPELTIQKIIQYGLKKLKEDPTPLRDIFAQHEADLLDDTYGGSYTDKITAWFLETKIPVVQAWSFNMQKIPSISIKLANETEDENKAAIGDFGIDGPDFEMGIARMTAMVDIGIHTSKTGDYVLWLYYIIMYILFRHKPYFEKYGMQLQTFSASDYTKDQQKMPDNTWTRWIRFRCTTDNTWIASGKILVDDVNTYPAVDLPESYSIAVSRDVNIQDVERTSNKGITLQHYNLEEDEITV